MGVYTEPSAVAVVDHRPEGIHKPAPCQGLHRSSRDLNVFRRHCENRRKPVSLKDVEDPGGGKIFGRQGLDPNASHRGVE